MRAIMLIVGLAIASVIIGVSFLINTGHVLADQPRAAFCSTDEQAYVNRLVSNGVWALARDESRDGECVRRP